MLDDRKELFYWAAWFDNEMRTNFTRTDVDSGHTVKLNAHILRRLLLKSGSFRNALLNNELILFNDMLYTADAFDIDGDIRLKDEALKNPEKYCLSVKKVEYEGSEIYYNPEPFFDMSSIESYAWHRQRMHGWIRPEFVFSSGPHNKPNPQDEQRKKPKDVKWISSVYFAPDKNISNFELNKKNFDIYKKEFKEIPESFGEALRHFVFKSSKTQEELAYEAGISVRNLNRILNNEEQQPKLETVVALCIALHLFPLFSNLLIQKAGYTLRSTESGIAYQMILNMFYTENVDMCNRFLYEIGFQPLTKKEE